jgi:uncharacterized membrane protein required for colicin V production
VDVVGAIRNLNLFDLLVAFFLFGFFVAGFIQGTVRRLIGLGVLVVSILLAINLRDPFGSWLAGYWTQFPRDYSTMMAFGVSFVVIYGAGSILVQVFYRRTTLFKRSTVVDEVIGGLLGILQAVLLVGVLITILDSFYRIPGVQPSSSELGILHDIYRAYDPSQTAIVFRDTLIPAFLALFAWITPAGLRDFFA